MRQTELDDMNAGSTFYNYDSFDNVIFQQDANGNIMETEYDELGRIVERKVKEADVVNANPPTYNYEYYEDGPEETLLKKETAPSGHATEYIYDDDQNIASITEIIEGEAYATSFNYDEFGKPTRKEYPSGFAIRYEYDNKDYLERITSDDGPPSRASLSSPTLLITWRKRPLVPLSLKRLSCASYEHQVQIQKSGSSALRQFCGGRLD